MLIWIAVLTAAVISAAVFADDDPTTDESSGFGALAAVVGGILTAVYLALTKPDPSSMRLQPAPRPVRECPSCGAHMECDARVCATCGSESRPWIRHEDVWWFQSQSGAWQWLDEQDGVWRWYEAGAPSTVAADDATPGSNDPAGANRPTQDPREM